MCDNKGPNTDRNIIRWEILEDGTISIQTGSFSPEVHASADEALALLEKLAGGQRTVTQTKSQHLHHHHGQQHGQQQKMGG